jgi:hypothetical protein
VIIISEKHNLICPSFYIPRRLHLFRSRIFLRFYNLISPSFHIPRRLHGFRSSPFSGFPPDYKSSSPALPHLLRIFAGSPLSRYISSSNKYRHFSVSQTEKRKKQSRPSKPRNLLIGGHGPLVGGLRWKLAAAGRYRRAEAACVLLLRPGGGQLLLRAGAPDEAASRPHGALAAVALRPPRPDAGAQAAPRPRPRPLPLPLRRLHPLPPLCHARDAAGPHPRPQALQRRRGLPRLRRPLQILPDLRRRVRRGRRQAQPRPRHCDQLVWRAAPRQKVRGVRILLCQRHRARHTRAPQAPRGISPCTYPSPLLFIHSTSMGLISYVFPIVWEWAIV